jgi:hypothetical protein
MDLIYIYIYIYIYLFIRSTSVTNFLLKLQLKFIYERQSVCLGVGLSSGAQGRIFVLCLSIEGSLMRGALSDERINCFWALPKQSLWVSNSAELAAIFYCLI